MQVQTYSIQGKRGYQEDRYITLQRLEDAEAGHDGTDTVYLGCYDGHSGYRMSEYVKCNLHLRLLKDKDFKKDPSKALERSFLELEKEWVGKCEQWQKEEIEAQVKVKYPKPVLKRKDGSTCSVRILLLVQLTSVPGWFVSVRETHLASPGLT